MEETTASRDESEERVKRKRRKKDLEEIRRNALAFKRNLRSKVLLPKKSNLIKTLNQFSSQRQGIEDVVNSQNPLLNRTKAVSEPEPLPPNLKGFFLAGVKGKLTTRARNKPKSKLKEAILKGDALQILRSGGLNNKNPNEIHSLSNNFDAELKSKLAQILGNSPEIDTDENESDINSIKTSPILGGGKRSIAKRGNLSKSDAEITSKNENFQKKVTAAGKNISKNERCKRRLFEDEKTNVNSNNNTESVHDSCTNVDSALRVTPRKFTPENVIYFTEHVPQKDVNKKVQNAKKINPKDPHLIKYYVETCKKISERELKNIFSLICDDPLEKAKAALRVTYINTVKACLQQQTSRNSRTSNSEIMLEPDSGIARTLKKNAEVKATFMTWNPDNSPYSSRNDEIDDLESEFSAVLSDKIEKSGKRKHAPSTRSEHSERDFPISVRAVVDPESTNIKMKMDSIDPNRQELIARYLKDIDTSSHQYYKSRSIFNDERILPKETDGIYYQKEKLFISDSNKQTVMFHKSAKHVPTILRKSRAVDNTDRCKNLKETITKATMQDLIGESKLISETSPDSTIIIPNQLMEAPKCKYIYMNAKYNQPPRINAAQKRVYQRNSVSEHQLCMSPTSTDRDFVLFPNYELSPIKEQVDLFKNAHNHHKCLFSQEICEQDPNYMVRMPSFGEIQEKTDRLTLQSSQSQPCSQESMNHMHYSQELCNLEPNYCKQYEISNNAMYSNQSCLRYKESYPLKPDFQMVQPETNDYSFLRSKDLKYPLNNCHTHRNQSSQHQEVPIGYKLVQQQNIRQPMNVQQQNIRQPMNVQQQSIRQPINVQQQGIRQPMKYVAVDGKRVPQRHPVYSINDNHSHTRKLSMQNQQPIMQMKHFHSGHMQNQAPCCTISSLQYSDQEDLQQPTISPTYDYENTHQTNMVASNPSGLLNYNTNLVGLNGHAISYVPSSITDRSFNPNQNIPMIAAVNKPRYMGQHLMPSSSYSQVEYQHNPCNNKDFKVNDIYFQQMHHNIHLKRP